MDETEVALGPLFVAIGALDGEDGMTRLYNREGVLLLVLDPSEALDLCSALMARQDELMACYGEWLLHEVQGL